MTVTSESHRLMDFLEAQFFRPVLDSNPDSFPPYQRDDAERLRDRIQGVRQQIRAAGSPDAIVREFDRIADEEGQSLDSKLTSMGFPTVSDIRYDVDKLGAELGLSIRDELRNEES